MLVSQITSNAGSSCTLVTSFKPTDSLPAKHKCDFDASMDSKTVSKPLFPPLPPTKKLRDKIVQQFCVDTSSELLSEEGCAVCGQLVLKTSMSVSIDNLTSSQLSSLIHDGENVTRCERKHSLEPCRQFSGPIFAPNCKRVCNICCITPRCLS